MVQIVINYDPGTQEFRIYEPMTDTILVSSNLTEAFVVLSDFLVSTQMISGNILDETEISYHFDSYTVKAMIESNVNLIKRLKSGPSGFTIASQRFGGSSLPSPQQTYREKKSNPGMVAGGFSPGTTGFGKKGFGGQQGFSGKSGFKNSDKKFGNNKR